MFLTSWQAYLSLSHLANHWPLYLTFINIFFWKFSLHFWKIWLVVIWRLSSRFFQTLDWIRQISADLDPGYIFCKILWLGRGGMTPGKINENWEKRKKKGMRKEKGEMKERKRGRMKIFYTQFCDNCSVLYIILTFHYLR